MCLEWVEAETVACSAHDEWLLLENSEDLLWKRWNTFGQI